jgi:hypothetical protein
MFILLSFVLLVVLINCMDPERQVNLKHGERYSLTDMAVTSDNKLLLCNDQPSHHKVYIYKDCKTYEDEIDKVGYFVTMIRLFQC